MRRERERHRERERERDFRLFIPLPCLYSSRLTLFFCLNDKPLEIERDRERDEGDVRLLV